MIPLTTRLRTCIAHMASHQREREQGQLLIEALAEIERLENLVERYQDQCRKMLPNGGSLSDYF